MSGPAKKAPTRGRAKGSVGVVKGDGHVGPSDHETAGSRAGFGDHGARDSRAGSTGPTGSNGRAGSNGHGGSINGNGGSNGHGRSNGGRRLLGSVDYTLAKRALLREFHGGLLSQLDICDAHPELMRAAKYVGEPTTRPCPVCDTEGLRLLAYVYADDLKTDNGRVWELREALAVTAAHRGGSCYVVEVCTRCSWNHLYRSFRARSAG